MNDNKNPKARAPYNFVPFPNASNIVYRYKNKSELPSHGYNGSIIAELNTGWIEYTVANQTPLYIGNGNGEFFHINKEYMIPGSTMRGRIRANAEILSHAQPQFIDDQKFWYRGLADKCSNLRNQYNNHLKNISVNRDESSIEDSVQAGYLSKVNGKYRIKPVKTDSKGRYFQSIHESRLRTMDIAKQNVEHIFMYKNVDWEQLRDLKKRRAIRERNQILKDDAKNNGRGKDSFAPYSIKVWYEINDRGIVTNISKNFKQNWNEGYLMNSTNLGNKQRHYLIYGADTTSSLPISRTVVAQYKVNVKARTNHEKNLFSLDKLDKDEENGGVKSIFYKLSKNKGDHYVEAIAFTPYMKLPYKKGIGEAVASIHSEKIDYVQAIFGMTDPTPYKGRVVFDNLKITSKDSEKASLFKDQVRLPLVNPKPTSFQLYLKQAGDNVKNLVTYNDAFELRGYKFYYLKESEDLPSGKQIGDHISTIKAMKENTEFSGRIYFENLYDDELGLLLRAIKPFEGKSDDGKVFDSIGQGKPFGFGRVKIDIKDLILQSKDCYAKKSDDIFDQINEIAQSTTIDQKSDRDYENSKNQISEFKDEFKRKITDLSPDLKIFSNENQTMESFLFSKMNIKETSQTQMEAYQYMNLWEFKNRAVLPTVEEIKNGNVNKKGIKKKKSKENFTTKVDKGISRLNQNMDNSIYENVVLKQKRLLVLSPNANYLRKIESIFKDFRNVSFESIETAKRVSRYDIIVFNGYDGSVDRNNGSDLEKLEEFMSKYKNKAFVYYNTNFNQRYNGNFDGAFHFSSTPVTLYNAIIDVSRYSDQIK
jgi:CRISPR-associated protein (TIGR03986 family)